MTREVLDRPTFAKFIRLLDNYESSTGTSEIVTDEEIKENWDFINSITDTKVQFIAYANKKLCVHRHYIIFFKFR